MKVIKNQKEFVRWLTEDKFELDQQCFERHSYHIENEMLVINKLNLEATSFSNRHFFCTQFNECIFENCDLTDTVFFSCEFENCKFINCKITDTKFIDVLISNCFLNSCIITGLEIADGEMPRIEFNDCSEILDLIIRGDRIRKVKFTNCYLHYMQIEPISNEIIEEFNFIDCIVNESSFDRIRLTNQCFLDCSLSLNQFSACNFGANTFQNSTTPSGEYNMIDFRSIIESPILNPEILEKLFGINSPDVKEYLTEMTSKIEYQTIFISYSFKDKDFANFINQNLRKRGIFTFLFERDSEAGKTLNSIMSEGIKNKDRILFIASKDSLKSRACHFELSEGRKKQEQTWMETLFPIHIDNFLFEVQKEQIRPVEKQDEFWKNIEELRKINSLSFVDFVESEKRNSQECEKLLMRLIKGLRK